MLNMVKEQNRGDLKEVKEKLKGVFYQLDWMKFQESLFNNQRREELEEK